MPRSALIWLIAELLCVVPADSWMSTTRMCVGDSAPLTRRERRQQNRRTAANRRHTVTIGDVTIPVKSKLSQNLLVDESVISKVCSSVVPIRGGNDGAGVLEIGAGLGAISEPLHRLYPAMTAIELDTRVVEALQEACPSLNVLQADALEFDLSSWAGRSGSDLTLVSNVPFGITSRLLYHLVEHRGVMETAVLILQAEVVERLQAPPGHREYGALSVLYQLLCEADVLMPRVPKSAFSPVPKVATCIVKLDFRSGDGLGSLSDDRMQCLRQLLKAAFDKKGRNRKLVHSVVVLLGVDADRMQGAFSPVVLELLEKRPTSLTPGELIKVADDILDVYGIEYSRAVAA